MAHHPRLALAFCACLLTGVTALAQSKVELDKVVKMKDWGYQIQPIKGWNTTVAGKDERFTVGKWKMNLDDLKQRGDYEAYRADSLCELQIIRIAPTAVTPSGDKPKAPDTEKNEPTIHLTPAMQKRYNPKTVEDWIEGNYEGAAKRWVRKPLKGSKMPGELIEFGSGAEAITIGYFLKDGIEWAVAYTSFEENYKKTWQDIYLKSILTFNVTELVNADVVAASKKDITKLAGQEKRDALHATIAGLPGWYAIDKPHYVFLSNSKNRAFLEGLANEIEVVREQVYTKNFPPRNKDIPLSPVRVLDTQSEYYQFGGPGGSAGYFSSDSGELVLFTRFEDVTKANSLNYCRSVMFHEGFHQYVHYAIGDVSPHSWFNEGHGDYFAGLSVAGGAIKVSPFSWRVSFLKDHLRSKNDLIPVRTLIRMPQREYYSNAGLKYSEGWALIYFLRSVTKNPRYKQILDTYFTYLADNVEAFRAKQKEKKGGDEGKPEPVPGIPGLRIINFEDEAKVEKILSEAVDKAFEGVDLEALDKEFHAWVEKL
jgi:hypothetical protein